MKGPAPATFPQKDVPEETWRLIDAFARAGSRQSPNRSQPEPQSPVAVIA